MFFKRRKIKREKIEETKKKMLELFKNNIDNSDNYNLVYGYHKEFFNEIGDFIYTSLVIGYDLKNLELIIISTDKDFSRVQNIIRLTKKDFTKAIFSKNLEEYIIYFNKKKQDKISFSLITKNYIDIDILAFIEQESEVEDFKDFYQDFKRIPRFKRRKEK
ncbi:MAG: hypothetical protein IKN63_05650 [Bacilli bacterium]|nr:hypothetical protein [Bacilli bacterium]